MCNVCVLMVVQVKRSQIRKGMVMVDPVLEPVACWEFDGDILVLHHPTTISAKYQAMGKQESQEYCLLSWKWLTLFESVYLSFSCLP